jgi:hypothetical protein
VISYAFQQHSFFCLNVIFINIHSIVVNYVHVWKCWFEVPELVRWLLLELLISLFVHSSWSGGCGSCREVVHEQTSNTMYMDTFYVTKLNSVEVKEKYQVIILNRFAAFKSLEANVDISRAWKILENIITLTKEIISNYMLCQCKPWLDKDCS